MFGAAPNDAAEATLMMPRGWLPCAARRTGVNTWQPWMGPHRLTPRVQVQSSIGIVPIEVPPAPTPALLTTRVGGPSNQPWASVASFVTSATWDTSQRSAVARPPSAVIAAAVRSAPASSISLQTTAPPRRASSRANAAPMPLPAPVTTAAARWLRLGDRPKSMQASQQPMVTLVNGNIRVGAESWPTGRASRSWGVEREARVGCHDAVEGPAGLLLQREHCGDDLDQPRRVEQVTEVAEHVAAEEPAQHVRAEEPGQRIGVEQLGQRLQEGPEFGQRTAEVDAAPGVEDAGQEIDVEQPAQRRLAGTAVRAQRTGDLHRQSHHQLVDDSVVGEIVQTVVTEHAAGEPA